MSREHGIPCPGCGRRRSRVINSRFNDATIRRRRLCDNCGGRFTTLEQVIEFTPRAQVRRGAAALIGPASARRGPVPSSARARRPKTPKGDPK